MTLFGEGNEKDHFRHFFLESGRVENIVAMGRKCVIKGCKTNYLSLVNESKNDGLQKTIKTYSFPNKSKHQQERSRWIKSIPFWKEDEIDKMSTPVVCEKHWPVGFAEKKGDRGRMRPVDPPSIFEGTNKSSIPTPPPKRATDIFIVF